MYEPNFHAGIVFVVMKLKPLCTSTTQKLLICISGSKCVDDHSIPRYSKRRRKEIMGFSLSSIEEKNQKNETFN